MRKPEYVGTSYGIEIDGGLNGGQLTRIIALNAIKADPKLGYFGQRPDREFIQV